MRHWRNGCCWWNRKRLTIRECILSYADRNFVDDDLVSSGYAFVISRTSLIFWASVFWSPIAHVTSGLKALRAKDPLTWSNTGFGSCCRACGSTQTARFSSGPKRLVHLRLEPNSRLLVSVPRALQAVVNWPGLLMVIFKHDTELAGILRILL